MEDERKFRKMKLFIDIASVAEIKRWRSGSYCRGYGCGRTCIKDRGFTEDHRVEVAPSLMSTLGLKLVSSSVLGIGT